jgi:hypothetical protein
MSEALETYACVAPSSFAAPSRVASSLTSFTISWSEPAENGGCPVLGYAVFRDNADNGAIATEVNTDLDTNIRDKPSLRQMTITNYEVDSLGLTFTY